MKSANSIAYTIIFLLTLQTAIAQSVGIGTSTPDASARLQISSSTQGILLPTLTAAQRSAINNPATGLLVFQTDGMRGFYYYAGGTWVNLTSGYTANNQGTAVSRYYGLTFTLAGSGTRTFADGQGTEASFNLPAGIAIDAAGNVYVADLLNHRIRMITPTGLVSTLAGTGTAGANNGPRSSATFENPGDVAFDASGNLYVSDRVNNMIRKIGTDGMVTTFAGSGAEGYADGRADTAKFDTPEGIAVDASGNVYVADQGNNKIRKITPAGMVSTLAGNGIGAVEGPGNIATFRGTTDVAVDAEGNVFVTDQGNHKIRKIDTNGEVTTFAGTGLRGEEDGEGTAASFESPQGITIDLYGNLYVADRENHKIRKITAAGFVSTLSGTGLPGAADGAGVVATFSQPIRLATDAFGDVYVADFINAKIRKIIAQ